MHRSRRDANRHATLEAQRAYYASRRPPQMRVSDTAYARRHFEEVRDACGLATGEAVCEWGAGLGRFSSFLAGMDLELTAIELSPSLAAECSESLADRGGARVETGDVLEVLERSSRRFDAMVGFFVLHHLADLADYFATAADRLHPGGRMAFVEPNPFSPLYPVQISVTPGMQWRLEAGIYRLWPRRVRRTALGAGFRRVEIGRYGALPRRLYDALAARGLERLPERLIPSVLRPFQRIVAWR